MEKVGVGERERGATRGPTRISLRPMATEEWSILPPRERKLQCIGDVIAYWIAFVTEEYRTESIEVTPDTYVMLAGDNAPPVWPTIGQLSHWLEVLRDAPPQETNNARA